MAVWPTRPLRLWSWQARWLAIVLVVLAGVGQTLVKVQLPTVFHSPDSSHYLQIAAGHTELVEQPFASRQLGPLVAAGLGKLLGGSLHGGFLLQGFLSLALAMGVTCWLATKTAAPRWLLLAMMLVPSWAVLLQYLVLPDLWYAAMLAVLLVLLEKRWFWAAALWMLPLTLSRESTSLTLLCFLVAAWPGLGRRRWQVAAVAFLAAAAGSVVVGRLAAASQANVEHLPQVVYMFAKVPWNFLRNVLGVLPWSDANTELCTVPVWSVPFRFGPVHSLGVCGFSVQQQLQAVEGTLINFGTLPLLVAVLWWRHRKVRDRSVLLRFALLYGGVSFLLAPVLGAGFVHLMQYAWPLFLVALPKLFDEELTGPLSAKRAWASVGFFGLSLAVPWIAWWPVLLSRLAMGLAIWVVGYGLLRVWLGDGAEVQESAPL